MYQLRSSKEKREGCLPSQLSTPTTSRPSTACSTHTPPARQLLHREPPRLAPLLHPPLNPPRATPRAPLAAADARPLWRRRRRRRRRRLVRALRLIGNARGAAELTREQSQQIFAAERIPKDHRGIIPGGVIILVAHRGRMPRGVIIRITYHGIIPRGGVV